MLLESCAKAAKARSRSLAKELDGVVRSFRERPWSGPYRHVWLDALELKSPEGGRLVNVACLVRDRREQRRSARGARPGRGRGRGRRGLARVSPRPASPRAQGRSSWRSPMLTRASRTPSPQCCAARPGNAVGRISSETCSPGTQGRARHRRNFRADQLLPSPTPSRARPARAHRRAVRRRIDAVGILPIGKASSGPSAQCCANSTTTRPSCDAT